MRGTLTDEAAQETTVADMKRLMGQGNIIAMRGRYEDGRLGPVVIYAEGEAAEHLEDVLLCMGIKMSKPKPGVKA